MYCEECHQYPHADGCPNENKPKVVAICVYCQKELTDNYEIGTADDENTYCDVDCFKAFYGYRIKEFEEVRKED